MGLRDFFIRQNKEITQQELDLLLEVEEQKPPAVTRAQAISLLSVYANVELIANTIGNLEVKLYREYEGSVEEVKEDKRIVLLNDEANNFMTGDELKKVWKRPYEKNNDYIVLNEGLYMMNYNKQEKKCK